MICYTIGHGNRNLYDFIDVIKSFKIDCVMDIRSDQLVIDPSNSFYFKHNIREKLNTEGINWIDMNDSFNVEKNNVEELLANKKFVKGINKLVEGLNRGHRIALLGSSYSPIECNRGLVIGYVLKDRGINVCHILDQGLIYSQSHIEELVIKEYMQKNKRLLKSKSDIQYEDVLFKGKKEKNKMIIAKDTAV